jgi:hypothetical protein
VSLLWSTAIIRLQEAAEKDPDGYYYHVSPKYMLPGTVLHHPGGFTNFDESTGEHAYVTPSRERAEHYNYLLWEQGHPNIHTYEVHAEGDMEPDPNDEDSFRTRDPVRVLDRIDRHRNTPVYKSPSGEEWRH